MKRFLLLILPVFFICQISAAKDPTIILIVKDKSTDQTIYGYSNFISKISSKEKKDEPFLYRVDIKAENYNSYTTMLSIPQAFKNKEYKCTNYLEPLIQEKAPPPPPSKQNFSGFVLDQAQDPMPNVLVICLDTNDNNVAQVVTGGDGKYVFTNIDPGKHKIRIISNRKLNAKSVAMKTNSRISVPGTNQQVVPSVSTNKGLKESEYEPLTTNVLNILSRKDQILQIMVTKKRGLLGVIPAILCAGKTNFIGPANNLDQSADACLRTNDTITIDGKRTLCGEKNIITDGIPFDLFLYPVYSDGHKATSPFIMKGLTTIDTIPPPMPVLDDVVSSNGKIYLSWHRVDKDNDPLNYRVYAGPVDDMRPVHYFFRATTNSWMKEVFTNTNKSLLDTPDLRFSLTAIDSGGNESEFRDLTFDVDQSSNNMRLPDTVLDRLNPAFIEKPYVKPPPPDFQVLLANNYIIKSGTTLRIKNKTFDIPKGRSIILMKNSKLILENVNLRCPSGLWKGIQVQDKSALSLIHVRISGAETGISLVNGAVLDMNSSVIWTCQTGIKSYKGVLRIASCILQNNRKAMLLSDSYARMKSCDIISNSENISLSYCNAELLNCRIRDNRSSFVLTGGNGKIQGCDILRNTGDGISLSGAAFAISGCVVSGNNGNGIVSSGSNPQIHACDIFGNSFYGIRGGGRITGCFVSANNGSQETDNTPDNGSDDGKMFSFSNQSIQQIYQADSIRGLRTEKNRK